MTAIIARLGHVLYWLGCLVSGLSLAGAVLVWTTSSNPKDAVPALLFAVVAWLVGKACRYVLSGD